MTAHIRKQIRDAAKNALTGLATTGANVFSGRISPLQATELPGLMIFLNGDDATEDAYNGGPTEMRSGTLRIEGVATGSDTMIDTLDAIAAEVEVALFGNAAFLALLMVTPSPPSAGIVIDEPTEGVGKRIGSVILGFPIQYRTRLGDPTTKV